MTHKLKIQFWQNGTLMTRTHEFPDFDSAFTFASKIKKQSLIRVYNEYNELVHQILPQTVDELVYG